MTFGRYLRRHAIVSEEQLKDATAALVLFGGRLGTHLVERGALNPDELERHLAAHSAALTALPQALIHFCCLPSALLRGSIGAVMRRPGGPSACW